jgi:hypothetical protein
VLLDGQSLERLDRGFGRALRLQVGREDVYVVIEPLQILLLDRRDAFQDLAGVEKGFGICEGVGGSGWWLAINEGKGIVRTRSVCIAGKSSQHRWMILPDEHFVVFRFGPKRRRAFHVIR